MVHIVNFTICGTLSKQTSGLYPNFKSVRTKFVYLKNSNQNSDSPMAAIAVETRYLGQKFRSELRSAEVQIPSAIRILKM